jgi:hypothetical protein
MSFFNILNRRCILFSAMVAFSLYGCSSKQEASDEEAQEPVDAAPVDPAAAPAPSDAPPAPAEGPGVGSTSGPSAPAVPSSIGSVPAAGASDASMNSSHRVMYVKASGAKLFDKASKDASVVGKLKKGDHLLVTIEGDWARTEQGQFVPLNSLSQKGVGRPKTPAHWSGGSKSSHRAAKGKAMKTAPAPAAAESAGKSPEPTPDVQPAADGADKEPAAKN